MTLYSTNVKINRINDDAIIWKLFFKNNDDKRNSKNDSLRKWRRLTIRWRTMQSSIQSKLRSWIKHILRKDGKVSKDLIQRMDIKIRTMFFILVQFMKTIKFDFKPKILKYFNMKIIWFLFNRKNSYLKLQSFWFLFFWIFLSFSIKKIIFR